MEDLRGKRIGTTSLKEGTAIMVQKIFAAHGLHYPGDYEFALVGAHPQRWEKLQEGSIEAGLQLLPYSAGGGIARFGKPDIFNTDKARTVHQLYLHQHPQGRRHPYLDGWPWRWMDNRDEGARMLAAETHASVAHAERGLFELFEGGASPRDLRISRPASSVFEAMRDAGLVGRDAALL